MKCSVVRIGNSRGIRIPKTILKQCNLEEAVDLEVEGDRLVIRPAKRPRAGWAAAFQEMARRSDDVLIDGDSWGSTDWDRTEWTW